MIPLHTGVASVGAVVDSADGQEGIRELGVDLFFAEQIARAPRTAAMLAEAELRGEPAIVRDWSYTSRELAGYDFVLAGDAACFVDPLFSSGVHLALSSGVLAAAYVTSALKDPELGRAAAAVYDEQCRQQYGHFREMAQLFYASNRTAESYFWEARRVLEANEDTPPRLAFVRAVAGQPPQGYERAVLARGEAPREFADAVGAFERERGERATRAEALFAEANREALLASRPRLAAGTRLERKPVVAEGEFEWGQVVASEARPEGAPVSDLVAALVGLIDGESTVADLLGAFKQALPAAAFARVAPQLVQALRILYVDGVIAEIAPGSEA